MINKTKFLSLFLKLPDRIQRNRILTSLFLTVLDQHKAKLQQEIIKAQWQVEQLRSRIKNI